MNQGVKQNDMSLKVGLKVNYLLYANDAVLIASEQEVQAVVTIRKEAFKYNDLGLNIEMSKCQLSVTRKIIGKANEIVYQGSMLRGGGRCEMDMVIAASNKIRQVQVRYV